jgi:hypothetical protein
VQCWEVDTLLDITQVGFDTSAVRRGWSNPGRTPGCAPAASCRHHARHHRRASGLASARRDAEKRTKSPGWALTQQWCASSPWAWRDLRATAANAAGEHADGRMRGRSRRRQALPRTAPERPWEIKGDQRPDGSTARRHENRKNDLANARRHGAVLNIEHIPTGRDETKDAESGGRSISPRRPGSAQNRAITAKRRVSALRSRSPRSAAMPGISIAPSGMSGSGLSAARPTAVMAR